MSNDYEWLRFVDLDKIATDEEIERIAALSLIPKVFTYEWKCIFRGYFIRKVLLCFGLVCQSPAFVRFVIDLGATKAHYEGRPWQLFSVAREHKSFEILIDSGVQYFGTDYDLKIFISLRESARLGAIAAIGAIRSRGRLKDISRIIGRLIWASRKYYQSD